MSSDWLNTILLLEEYNISFQVTTVLTKYNDSIESLAEIFNFLKKLKNVSRWEIRIAFKSLYSKKDFDSIKISKSIIDSIDQWIRGIRETAMLNILWSPNDMNKYFKSENGSNEFLGSRCSANLSHMVILPDGKVTICEQLYWDPRFIIGDISKQTIEEIWNSPRALKLAFPQRSDFRDQSVCKTCDIFDKCFSFPNKCFADILKGYGKENWDYPDPRCKKAPKFKHDLLHF